MRIACPTISKKWEMLPHRSKDYFNGVEGRGKKAMMLLMVLTMEGGQEHTDLV